MKTHRHRVHQRAQRSTWRAAIYFRIGRAPRLSCMRKWRNSPFVSLNQALGPTNAYICHLNGRASMGQELPRSIASTPSCVFSFLSNQHSQPLRTPPRRPSCPPCSLLLSWQRSAHWPLGWPRASFSRWWAALPARFSFSLASWWWAISCARPNGWKVSKRHVVGKGQRFEQCERE